MCMIAGCPLNIWLQWLSFKYTSIYLLIVFLCVCPCVPTYSKLYALKLCSAHYFAKIQTSNDFFSLGIYLIKAFLIIVGIVRQATKLILYIIIQKMEFSEKLKLIKFMPIIIILNCIASATCRMYNFLTIELNSMSKNNLMLNSAENIIFFFYFCIIIRNHLCMKHANDGEGVCVRTRAVGERVCIRTAKPEIGAFCISVWFSVILTATYNHCSTLFSLLQHTRTFIAFCCCHCD